jgi:tetratricopeptide (TPR) repeat protein
MSILVATAALAVMGEPACEAASVPLDAVQAHLQADALHEAERQAENAIDAAPDCILAHLALVRVLQDRLEDANGLGAMGLSRRYRRSVADALEIDPDNVEARTAEIGYLIYAPRIAGGDKARAAERIASLGEIDPLAGARMTLQLARTDGENDAIVSALSDLAGLTLDDFNVRSEFARRLILAERYHEAEAELRSWPDGEPMRQAELGYLRGGLRVLGEFELEAAEALLVQSLEIEREADAPSRWPPEDAVTALIGAAREARGNTEGAREAYMRALELNPENTRATEGLARLGPP